MEAVQIESGYGQSIMGQSDCCVIKELPVGSVARLQPVTQRAPYGSTESGLVTFPLLDAVRAGHLLLCDIPLRGAWVLVVD